MTYLLVLLAVVLPMAGTKYPELPAGKGRAEVEAACYACHSSDILVQQRLTEKQWTATIDKMIRWGAEVKDRDRSVMIAYLSKHFGAGNQFTPAKTKPVQ